MRSRFTWLTLIFFFGLLLPQYGAASPIDSLKALIASGEHDTLRARHNHEIGKAFFNTDLDSAMFYWQAALKLGELLSKNEDPAVMRAGKMQVMKSASNSAVIHQYRGLYPLALRQYQRCLRLADELHDQRGKMMALNNIGLIKMSQEKADEALDYFEQSHKIATERKDSMTISTTINNIGTALKRLKHYPEALEKFRESLRWAEIMGNDAQIADDLINIGAIQIINHQSDSALVTFQRSMELAIALEYSVGKPQILSGMSQAYSDLGEYEKALEYAQASLDSAKALDLTEDILGGLEQLADVQKKLGKHAIALETLAAYIQLKDSIFSTDKALEFGQLEQSFDYERQEYEAALQAERDATALREENLRQYVISFGTVCVIALLLILGIRLAKNRRLRYFVVFGALLVFFEFGLVLLDSFVDGLTGGLPIPKLLANILLAALLAPLNVLLERRLMVAKREKTE